MRALPQRAQVADLILDKRSTIPVYLQLKHHIIHLISSGAWQPNMPVPSVRQLAYELHLATATVQRAYGELQELGMLVGQPGRGVFVADFTDDLPELPGERSSILHGLLGRSVSHALSLGFSRQEIVATVRELGLGHGFSGRPRVIFVGSTPDPAEKYRGLLTEALQDLDVDVVGVTIDDVTSRGDALLEELEPIRCVVALVRTYAELRRLLVHRGTPLLGLVVALTEQAKQRIAELPRDAAIGLLAEERYLVSARTLVRQLRGVDDVIWAASDNRRAVRRVIEACPIIIHTLGVATALAAMAPSARLVELEYQPIASSIDQLRALIASPTTGHRRPAVPRA